MRRTKELFTKFVAKDYVGIERRSGECCSKKRPGLERVSGAFVLDGDVSDMAIFRQRSSKSRDRFWKADTRTGEVSHSYFSGL